MTSESWIPTWHLAGRTEISLAIKKGVPARTSTSKSSTTRASRARCLSARDNRRRVSPTTAKGVRPSACKACWKDFVMGVPMERAREDLIMLVSAPVSRVR